MKKILLIAAVAMGSFVGAYAQEGTAYPTEVELSKAKATWLGTSNAAGMTVTPLINYSDLSVGYNTKTGEFRRQQEGDVNTLKVNTSGTGSIGGIRVWGEFDYQNVSTKDSRYRTMNIDIEDDMPFYVADTRLSEWKHQAYDLKLRVATPFYWDWLSFGVYANYSAKSGAKQLDPRCSEYLYSIVVEPSALVKLGKHYIGATFKYRTGEDRTSPVNSNSQQDQQVFIMRGLGNYSIGVVGSLGGLGTYYYKTNRFGGAAQYGYSNDNFNATAEGYYTVQSIDAMQSPSKPKAMGSTLQKIGGGNINLSLTGDKMTHTLAIEGLQRNTNGIEFIQVIDQSYNVQQWVTIGEYVRSKYKLTKVDFEYNLFRNGEKGYDWMAGVSGRYSKEDDKYLLPESKLNVSNFFTKLFVKKSFVCNGTSLLVGLEGGYNHNIDKEYSYQGADATSRVVKDFYEKDCSMMGAHYWMAGANLNVTFPIDGSTLMYIKGSLQYYRSNDTMNNAVYSADKSGDFFWYYKAGVNANKSQRTLASITLGISF